MELANVIVLDVPLVLAISASITSLAQRRTTCGSASRRNDGAWWLIRVVGERRHYAINRVIAKERRERRRCCCAMVQPAGATLPVGTRWSTIAMKKQILIGVGFYRGRSAPTPVTMRVARWLTGLRPYQLSRLLAGGPLKVMFPSRLARVTVGSTLSSMRHSGEFDFQEWSSWDRLRARVNAGEFAIKRDD
jgi:hypothetical protein